MSMAESLWTDLLGVCYSQRYYDAGGIRTRVLEAGDPEAPALLMMHGVNGHAISSEFSGELLDRLETHVG